MNKGTIQTVGNMFTLSAGDDIGSKTQCLSYDAKNRPASFRDVSTGTLVECAYDYRGRRCTKKVTVAGTATRPLTFRHAEKGLMLFYAFDGNKNVSDLFFLALQNGIGAHYEYAPFGAVTRTSKATGSKVDLIGANPWRFSSEFYDSELDLVYYNYRHYSPTDGRWLSRDPIQEQGGLNLYAFVGNSGVNNVDFLGEIPGLLESTTVSLIVRDQDVHRVSAIKGYQACQKYNEIKPTCCCRDGEATEDSYPIRAKAICDAFVARYSVADQVIEPVVCVADCLVAAEKEIQKSNDCIKRNNDRLVKHVNCYVNCGFFLISSDAVSVPARGWEIGIFELLPDFLSYQWGKIKFFLSDW